jgi:hypothetical protein
MVSLSSLLKQGVKLLKKGKSEEAVGVFDSILAGLASGASGPQGQIVPDVEVDERSREGETMAIRELRLRALLGTTRYAETLRELDSQLAYREYFGSPKQRLQLLQMKVGVYLRAGDRQGVFGTLENLRLRTLGTGEFGEWATAQLQRFQFLSKEEMASLDERERLAREARRQARRQRRQDKRAK